MPDIAFLRERLCGAEEGRLVWRDRPKYGGRPVGCKGAEGYLCFQVRHEGKRHNFLNHRVIFALVHGRWPEAYIDHIDGNRLNNHPDNLREATPEESAQNLGLKPNASGFTGIVWHKGKWRAQLGFRYRRIHLGGFERPEDAHAAYLAAKAVTHSFQPIPRGA